MDNIRFLRGNAADRPALSLGEPSFDQNTGGFFIGKGTGDKTDDIQFNPAPPTSDYTVYVATTALGGDTIANGRTGKSLASGTTTSTSTNQLVDNSASFTASLVGMTVYNTTDNTYAKVTAFVSSTTLNISAHIMASGENYVIASSLSVIQEAFASVAAPYLSNPTIWMTSGTFTEDLTFIGKLAGGNYTLTLIGNGDTGAGKTSITGDITCRQTMSWTSFEIIGNVSTYGGSIVTWEDITANSSYRLLIYETAINYISNSILTIGNDPTNITVSGGTVTTGYTLYVATAALGGSTTADGLRIESGSATSTTANKLVNSGAAFTSALLNKTVYNTTDNTWAEITAVDSGTQLSLDTDIMASGEAYVIVNAFSTIQAALDAVPGTVNCDTTIKISNGTFSENVIIQGKAFSGAYELRLIGTVTLQTTASSATVSAGTGATQGTVTGSGFGTYDNKLVYLVTDDTWHLIDSDTATVLTLVGTADSSTTQDAKVYDWGTTVSGGSAVGIKVADAQTGVALEKLKITSTGTTSPDNTAVYQDPTSSIIYYECWIEHDASGFSVVGDGLSKLFFYRTLITNPTAGTGISSSVGSLNFWQSKAYSSGGSTGNGIILNGGLAGFRAGSIVDNYDSSQGGLRAESSGIIKCFSAASEGYPRIRNCVAGCYAYRGGQVLITTNNQYSGNTADETADATSYGYID